jgi:SAM-dependent methyltransferase
MSSHELRTCLCCGSNLLRKCLDLGCQPLANSYTLSDSEKLATYPLALNVCGNCWHSQLSCCVERSEIFDRYHYVSGTSETLRKYFKWFSESLASRMSPGARALEIAANDGSLLREMQNVGVECVGIDPAQNIVETARAEGLPVACGYWPAAASEIPGDFDAIVCMNVVAHVDDPQSFLAACRDKLRPEGVLLIQVSQARMLGNHEFDTCYHEHVSFFNSNSMRVLAESAGLKLVDAALVRIHGDSAIYELRRDDAEDQATLDAFREGEFAIADDLFAYEHHAGLFEWATYDAFRDRATEVVCMVRDEVARRRDQGFEIVFVGAAAKSMTLLNAGGIKPDRLLDESPLKIGLHAPGVGTRIDALTSCKQLQSPGFFVIAAWNFRDELIRKLRTIGPPSGSVFFSYFPKCTTHT